MCASTSCGQLGQVGSSCVPSACASPLLCLSCLVDSLFKLIFVRRISRWSGSVDFVAVCVLSGVAGRSVPSICKCSSADVRSVQCAVSGVLFKRPMRSMDGEKFSEGWGALYGVHGVCSVCLKVCDGE